MELGTGVVVSSVFLALSLIGLTFTLTTLIPQRRQNWASIPRFFASWLTGELALYHIAWQAAATAGFVAYGALEQPAGVAGLVITLLSWAGLCVALKHSRAASGVTESALRETLGTGYAGDSAKPGEPEPVPIARLLLPFRMRHPDIVVERDVAYGDAGKRNLLDIYRPRESDGRCPVLLQIHGGGWVIGNKEEQGGPLMRYLAARGWCCFAINYRLSPDAVWPDHLIDCKKALAWIREHAAPYGADPGLVVVTGGSAGGHLSSMMALTQGRAEFQPGFEDADTSVAACVPFYGVYDFLGRGGGGNSCNSMEPFLERYVLKCSPVDQRAVWEGASPIDQVGPAAPPFYVIHGTHDALASVDGARGFVEKLRSVSAAPVVYAELPGGQHAFEVFHSIRTEYVVRSVWRFVEHIRTSRTPTFS